MRDVKKICDVGPAHSNLGELMIVVQGLEEHTCHMWNFPQVLANILLDSHAGGAIFGFEKQNRLDKKMTFSRCSSMIGSCFYS